MTAPKNDRPSADEAIEATAAAWLAQRDAGWSAADADIFAQWVAADPRHADAVARLERTWATLAQLRNYRPAAARHPDCDLLTIAPKAKTLRFPAAVALATAASIAAAALWFLQARPPTHHARDEGLRHATTAGGYERLTLPDGSVMELNANSEALVRYSAKERRILLLRGQACFVVARQPARPFVVFAQSVAVRALGTVFDVRLGTADVEVIVAEGSVRVLGAAANDLPVLGAGERATIPVADTLPATREKLPANVLRSALAWQSSWLFFAETPLSEVVAQFNRRGDLQLILGDAELASVPIGGSFRADHVDAFVRLLSTSGEITVERTGPARIVLRKAR